jgi:hypothetical protein
LQQRNSVGGFNVALDSGHQFTHSDSPSCDCAKSAHRSAKKGQKIQIQALQEDQVEGPPSSAQRKACLAEVFTAPRKNQNGEPGGSPFQRF